MLYFRESLTPFFSNSSSLLSQFISLAKGDDPMSFTIEQAMVLIDSKLQADAPIGTYEGLPVQNARRECIPASHTPSRLEHGL